MADAGNFKYDHTEFYCRMGRHVVACDDAEMLRRSDGTCAYCQQCERINSDAPTLYRSLSKTVLREIGGILDFQLRQTEYETQNFDPPKMSDYEYYYSGEKPTPEALASTPPPYDPAWDEMNGLQSTGMGYE